MTSSLSTRDDWIPVDACTLPTAEHSLRRDDFDALFAEFLAAVEGVPSSHARLTLTGETEVAIRVRTLAAGVAHELD